MLESTSSLSARFRSLVGDPAEAAETPLRLTAVVFLASGDSPGLRRSLASLQAQTLPPARVLLVVPPGDNGFPGWGTAEAWPLATVMEPVAYPALASALLQDSSEALVLLHSGSELLPYRLEHDERLLRLLALAGVLSLPLLRPGAGHYQPSPYDLLPASVFRRVPARLQGQQLLDLPGGLAGSPWLLDCLTLRSDGLRAWLQPDDLSILPGLQSFLGGCGELQVVDRCLTACGPDDSRPRVKSQAIVNPSCPSAADIPVISVIVPCWNVENYVVDCLKSIRAQTFDRYEVICVDDGSTDGTSAILESYLREFPGNMRIITHGENLGLGDARNTAIAHARGEYLASVDSDDWIDHSMLEKLYSAAVEFDADIVSVGLKEISPRGAVVGRHSYARSHRLISESDNLFRLCAPAFGNKLCRRDLFSRAQISFPSGIYFEDLATTPRLLARASTIAYIEGTSYNYRQRKGSIVRSLGLKHILGYIQAFEILENFFSPRLAASSLFRSQFFDMVQDNLLYFLRCMGATPASHPPEARAMAAMGIGYLEHLKRNYGAPQVDWCSNLDVFLA